MPHFGSERDAQNRCNDGAAHNGSQAGGCRELTSLLLLKGMKRIALLGGTMLYTVNMSRLEGFKQAYDMMDQKIECASATPMRVA